MFKQSVTPDEVQSLNSMPADYIVLNGYNSKLLAIHLLVLYCRYLQSMKQPAITASAS